MSWFHWHFHEIQLSHRLDHHTVACAFSYFQYNILVCATAMYFSSQTWFNSPSISSFPLNISTFSRHLLSRIILFSDITDLSWWILFGFIFPYSCDIHCSPMKTWPLTQPEILQTNFNLFQIFCYRRYFLFILVVCSFETFRAYLVCILIFKGVLYGCYCPVHLGHHTFKWSFKYYIFFNFLTLGDN